MLTVNDSVDFLLGYVTTVHQTNIRIFASNRCQLSHYSLLFTCQCSIELVLRHRHTSFPPLFCVALLEGRDDRNQTPALFNFDALPACPTFGLPITFTAYTHTEKQLPQCLGGNWRVGEREGLWDRHSIMEIVPARPAYWGLFWAGRAGTQYFPYLAVAVQNIFFANNCQYSLGLEGAEDSILVHLEVLIAHFGGCPN